jgi:type IV pilus assembly protein PilB
MNDSYSEQRIAECLVTEEYLSQEQLDDLQKEDGRLIEKLRLKKIMSDIELCEFISEQYQIPCVDLGNHSITAELFDILPAAQAMLMRAVPYLLEENLLHVATADPFDLHLESKLEAITGHDIKLLLSSSDSIQAALDNNDGTQQILRSETANFKPVIVKRNEEGFEEAVALDSIGKDTAPVIRLVNSILLSALQKRASDIHIEAYGHGIEVKYRIDGVLYPATEVLELDSHSSLVSRIKVISELDIAEKQTPQDGRFKLRLNQRDIDFRVSILPSVYGEDIVIRVLDKFSIMEGVKNLSLENLGLSREVLKKFRKAIKEPYGMVLMTGPTGSGKTTTLYAALTELNTGEEKIITIEDPVEYQLEGIVQIPVNEKKNLTFSKGLRSILRHDPDKIMVGEIRDMETAQIAVQSALTGHLIFTTVHANNAFDVIGRFSHMGIDVYSFISSLNCVVAQRLVRKICPECKHEIKLTVAELEEAGLYDIEHKDVTFYEGDGCDHCNGTGYKGRVAITELLNLSSQLREMIIEKQPISETRQLAKDEGMVTLRESAIEKVLMGITTIKEINRVTFFD